jgi:AraC-like DNA-binding protein
MPMPRRTCHDDYPTLAKSGGAAFGGGPSPLSNPETHERAKSLLLAGRPVGAVAEEVGFSKPASFSFAFLRVVGMRPGAWRTAAGVELVLRSAHTFRWIKKRKRCDRTGHKPLPRKKRQA